jgi:hypothetical protein
MVTGKVTIKVMHILTTILMEQLLHFSGHWLVFNFTSDNATGNFVKQFNVTRKITIDANNDIEK